MCRARRGRFGARRRCRTLAYTAYSARGGAIAVAGIGGANARTLTPSSLASSDAAWSPDGRRIAFSATSGPTANIDIYVMAADGSDRRRLTTSLEADDDPTWSPDGDSIVFERDRGCEAAGCGAQEVWVMRADGKRQTRLTARSALDGDPAWSPDGRQIAFTSRRGIGASALVAMRPDGTRRKRITKAINADNPSWTPDGRTIAFDANLASQGASPADVNVYSVSAGGSGSHQAVARRRERPRVVTRRLAPGLRNPQAGDRRRPGRGRKHDAARRRRGPRRVAAGVAAARG